MRSSALFAVILSVVIQIDSQLARQYNLQFEFLGEEPPRLISCDWGRLLRQLERSNRNMRVVARPQCRLVPSHIFVVAVISLAGLISHSAFSDETSAEGTKETPEVWLCHHDVQDLADLDADWDFVRDHLDGIKVYIGSLMGTRKHVRISNEKLAFLAGTFEENATRSRHPF